MNQLNVASGDDSMVTSGYTVVIAAAKRARQIINGAQPLSVAATDRAVSIAVQEMVEGKLAVHAVEDEQEKADEARRYGRKQFGVMEIDSAAYDESALKPHKTYSSDDDDEGDDDLEARDDAYLVENEKGTVYADDETAGDAAGSLEDDEVYEDADEDLKAGLETETDNEAVDLDESELEPLLPLEDDTDEDTEDNYGDGDEDEDGNGE